MTKAVAPHRSQRAMDNAQAVLDFIERHPDHHDQDSWFYVDGTDDEILDYVKAEVTETTCNTTMCVAGTAMWNEYGRDGLAMFNGATNLVAQAEARKLLGLNEKEAQTIFYSLTNEGAVKALRRLAKGKKNLFKGLNEVDHGYWE